MTGSPEHTNQSDPPPKLSERKPVGQPSHPRGNGDSGRPPSGAGPSQDKSYLLSQTVRVDIPLEDLPVAAPQGTPAQKKKETTRVPLDLVAPGGVSGQVAKTIRLKKPSEVLTGGKVSLITSTERPVAARPAEARPPPVSVGVRSPTAKRPPASDTSRVSLENVLAPPAASKPGALPRPPTVVTVKLRRAEQPAPTAPAHPFPPSAGIPRAPQPHQSAHVTPGAGARPPTIRLKKPELYGRAAAPQSPEEAAGSPPEPSPVAPEPSEETARVALEEGAAGSPPGPSPDGIQTMRVKRVEAQDATGQTAKIALQEGKVAPPTKTDTVRTMKAKRVEASEGMGRTARIELQEGHSTAPQKPSSETVRTMKIKRTPDPETVRRQPVKPEQQTTITLTPEEEAAQGGVQTQRRTITIKRQEGMESERTMRLAQEEEEIRRERGDLTEGQPERVGWVCLVSAAALIVIGVMLWVFCTQLLPKSESFNWPGRILSFTDPFYQHGEPDWL